MKPQGKTTIITYKFCINDEAIICISCVSYMNQPLKRENTGDRKLAVMAYEEEPGGGGAARPPAVLGDGAKS